MGHEIVDLAGKQARGYVIPLGPVNLVVVVTDKGMVGCGAIDVAALKASATRLPGSARPKAAPSPASRICWQA